MSKRHRPTQHKPAKHFKSDGLPPRKISSFHRPSKEGLGVRMPAVYSIPCESSQVYIGQTCRSIDTRIKEYHRHIRLGHLDKLVVAEHVFHYNHAIKSQDTWILLTVPGFMDRLIREAVEMELHHNNMNREGRLNVSGSWKLLFRLLRDSRGPLSEDLPVAVTNLRLFEGPSLYPTSHALTSVPFPSAVLR
jgi:hypothetical protein